MEKQPDQTPPTPLTPDKGFEETFNNPEAAKQAGETAEAQQLREQKEQVEKQREEIKQALEKSIVTLKKFLEDNKEKLSDLERAKIEWAVNSAENAKKESLDKDDDEYLVKILKPDGSVTKDAEGNEIQRKEGAPVDGLKEALDLVAEVQKSSKEQKELASDKIKQANEVLEYLKTQDGLGITKRENLQNFLDKNAPELKSDLENLVTEWLKHDQDPSGQHHNEVADSGEYNFKFYLAQLAEASRQLQSKYQEQANTPELTLALTPEELSKIRETLQNSSKDYFETHYAKKHGLGLTKEESDQQHLFTEREAGFIDEDTDLRLILESKYQDQIPKYSELSRPEQNYQLAMLALRDREVLEMPKVPEAAAEPEPNPELIQPTQEQTPEEVKKILLINIDEIAKSMAWRKAEHKLNEFFRNSGYLKKVWKSFSEDYYRVKYYQEALKEITTNNSLLEAIRGRLEGQKVASTNPELKDYFQLLDQIIEQYEQNLVNTGEKGSELGQTPEVADLVARMISAHASGDIRQWQALGAEYADPGMDERARVELFVRNEIAPKISGANWGNQPAGKVGRFSKWMNRGKGEPSDKSIYANNLWKIAEQYKAGQEKQRADYMKWTEGELTPEQKAELEAKLAEHMKGVRELDIQLGTKERDLYNNKPKGVLKLYEKVLDAAEGKWYGKLLANPLTIGIGTALASRGTMSALRYGGIAAGSVAGVALSPYILPIIAGGLAGGAYRAFRTNKDLKYDLARERRNETLGGDKSLLLNERGGLRYGGMGYNEALGALNRFQGRDFASLSDDEKQGIAELKAMRDFEKQTGNKVDLFFADDESGSKTGSVIGLRNQLDLALRQWESQVDQAAVSSAMNRLKGEVDKTDKAEKSFRHRRAAVSGTVGAVVGMGAGLAAQEGIYILGRNLGLMETNRSSALEYIADKYTGSAEHSWNSFVGRANNLTVEGDPYVFVDPATGTKYTAEQALALKSSRPKFNIEDLKREDWHGVGRNFHGKELQQWHILDKKSGNVSIDVHNMMNNVNKNIDLNNTINWDKTTDPKMNELLSEMRSAKQAGNLHEHMQVRIFPTVEMYNTGNGINVGHIDETGRLVLDDEMRNYVFDGNGKQMARAIEVGYLDDRGGYHTLNTAVGSGEVGPPPIDDVILEELKPANYDFFTALIPPYRPVHGREGDKEKGKDEDKKPSGDSKNKKEARIINQKDYVKEKVIGYFDKDSKLAKSEDLTKQIDSLSEKDKEKLSVNLEHIRIDSDSEHLLKDPEFVGKLIAFTKDLDPWVIKGGYTVVFMDKNKDLQVSGKILQVNAKAELINWRFGIAAAKRILEKKGEKPLDSEKTTDEPKETGEVKEEDKDDENRPKWAKNKLAWKQLFVWDRNHQNGLLADINDNQLKEKIEKSFTEVEKFKDLDELVVKSIFADLVKKRSKAVDTKQTRMYDLIIDSIIKLPGLTTDKSKQLEKYYGEVSRNMNKGGYKKNKGEKNGGGTKDSGADADKRIKQNNRAQRDKKKKENLAKGRK